ncbi:enoyl- delta isomerase mitochondrial isoform X1 [Brachionus plicatilis]|uniref:Enoyl-delta isomerase mitochondrial isoform X1 n=1 Tax=Brachionus plicatilis TaxID=10195 RepID=A0A3M7QCS5_BRAPC|nr:enoyl- delta isomerase mitochondrial isoform X1 [Brachionus plicatilis]
MYSGDQILIFERLKMFFQKNTVSLFQKIPRNLGFFEKNLHLSKSALVTKEFEDAKTKLSLLKEDPGSDVKLKIYALFKQATVGACDTPKPSMVDFVNRAKWNAWSELKSLSSLDAEKEYIKLINELVKSEQGETNQALPDLKKFQDIQTSIEFNNVYKIVLNRPTKLNAITFTMYNELIEALSEAENNPNILMVCITGAGDYYCSGNDLTNFSSPSAMSDIKKAAKEGGILLENFVNSFINFSKPLVAVVNGPAVGISVTLMGLFDYVFASDKATFNAPFTKIAQSPEACSSYTFPRLMGPVKASEFLLFNRKLTAHEAFERNLVTEVIAHDEFQSKVWKKIEEFSKLPPESLLESRKLMRDGDKELLIQTNKKEVDVLVGRWSSNEFVRVIMEFWGNRSKK